MAIVYLRATGGSDADNGSTWALAKATLASAITAAGSGGTVYVAKGHAEVITGSTISGPGSIPPVKIIAVDDTGDPQPPTTLVTKDDATHPIFKHPVSAALSLSRWIYFYGCEFTAETTGFTNTRISVGTDISSFVVMEQCYINEQCTGSAGGLLSIGGSSNESIHRTLVLIDTKLAFKNETAGINLDAGSTLFIRGGSLSAFTTSANARVFELNPAADRSARIDVEGFDMSVLGSNQYVASMGSFGDVLADLRRIKTPATFGFVFTNQAQHGQRPSFRMHSFGSGDEFYQFYENGIEGSVEESTAIYRDGGATYNGTNGISTKLISSSNTAAGAGAMALRFKLCDLQLDLTTSTTLTVHTCQDAGTVLTNEKFYLEVEHPDSTDLAGGAITSSRCSPLATPANLAASSETWTGDSGSSTLRQASVTIGAITGATHAAVSVWACLAEPSTSLYVCPKVEVS